MDNYEKALPVIMSLFALLWAVYSFFRQRRDKIKEKLAHADTDLERAHLTESSELRRELRQEIRELKTEHEEMCEAFETVSKERLALRSEVSRLKIDSDALRDALKRTGAIIQNRDDIIEGLEKTIAARERALETLTVRLNNEAEDA